MLFNQCLDTNLVFDKLANEQTWKEIHDTCLTVCCSVWWSFET